MNRILPVVIAVVAIAALTIVEGRISDRWVDTNRPALYCATILEDVPPTIGEWDSTERETNDEVLRVAGAEGYISRVYRNRSTGEEIDVWLIVGHARDTAEHTPNVCYPSQGYGKAQKESQFQFRLLDGEQANFWTGMFEIPNRLGEMTGTRVFWAWFKPDLTGKTGAEGVDWIAPKNSRYFFGSTKALYKIYFTQNGRPLDEKPDDSRCLDFAREFLAVVNPVLEQANGGPPEGFDPATVKREDA